MGMRRWLVAAGGSLFVALGLGAAPVAAVEAGAGQVVGSEALPALMDARPAPARPAGNLTWGWQDRSELRPPELADGRLTLTSSRSRPRCGSKTTCAEMSSCEEAMYFLNQCGQRRLDRDGDGIPCESGPC